MLKEGDKEVLFLRWKW